MTPIRSFLLVGLLTACAAPGRTQPAPLARLQEASPPVAHRALDEAAVSPTGEYLLRLRPVRTTFDVDATPEEEALVARHFARLRKLWLAGECLLAGRCVDVADGYVVLRAASREEAERLAAEDPCVAAGVFECEVRPFVAALLHGRRPRVTRVDEARVEVVTTVRPSPAQCFELWSTAEGVTAFMGIEARVEARIGGPYEWYFLPDVAENAGARGGEGCRVLSLARDRMITFDWNAPPGFGELRGVFTHVAVLFHPLPDGGTRLELLHEGFGEGDEWAKVRAYFAHAWPSVVRAFEEHCSRLEEN